jgi:tetratricopeptide (TPR) repeat protein
LTGAKIWDAQLGKEVLTLRGHEDPVTSVRFSPDGQRVATASWDKTAMAWTTVSLTPAQQREADAVEWVQSLFAQPLCKAEVMERLREDRRLAPLFRQVALTVAEQARDDSQMLNDASWTVVCHCGASEKKYQQALRWARTAARLTPDDGPILNTLGAAQYRVGQYDKALQTLTRAAAMQRAPPGLQPADLAFLAMTQHQLGHAEQASRWLRDLRQRVSRPPWSRQKQVQELLRETEEVLKKPSRR